MAKLDGLNSIDVTAASRLLEREADESSEHSEKAKLVRIVRECHERLAHLAELEPEPEVVDYMWHIVRLHEIVVGAMASVPYNSILNLDMLWRCVFEQQLTVAVILGHENLAISPVSPQDTGQTRANLCAHLASCLWNDCRVIPISLSQFNFTEEGHTTSQGPVGAVC